MPKTSNKYLKHIIFDRKSFNFYIYAQYLTRTFLLLSYILSDDRSLTILLQDTLSTNSFNLFQQIIQFISGYKVEITKAI